MTIAYVCGNEVATSWHHSMMALVAYDKAGSGRVDCGGYLVMRYGSGGLPEARNAAVEAFLKEDKADWLFWIDTDMGFEPDIVDRLLEVADPDERPMVGALCFINTEDDADGFGGYATHPTPTVYEWKTIDGQMGWMPRYDFTPGEVVRVGGTGSAAILIHRSVFERVEAAYGRAWYTRVPNTTTGQLIGEDLAFCLRVGALDIPVHVHTGVETTHLKPIWLGADAFWQWRMLSNIKKQLDGQQVEVPA